MVAAVPSLIVNGCTYTAPLNPNADDPMLAHIIRYTSETDGGYRTVDLFKKVSKVAAYILKELGNEFAGVAEGVASKLEPVTAGMGLLRLPKVTEDAVKAVSTPQADLRSNVNLVKKVSDALSCWSYAGLFFSGNSAFGDMAKVADAANSVTSLANDYQDFDLASRHVEIIRTSGKSVPEVEERYSDFKQYSFMKVVKDVCSAASAILGLMVLALGGPLLPAIVLMGLGLASTVSAIGAHFFKETRTYTMPKFEELRAFA